MRELLSSLYKFLAAAFSLASAASWALLCTSVLAVASASSATWASVSPWDVAGGVFASWSLRASFSSSVWVRRTSGTCVGAWLSWPVDAWESGDVILLLHHKSIGSITMICSIVRCTQS